MRSAALLLALSSAACLTRTVDGSGRPTTELRDVGAFDSVAVSDTLHAVITLAPDAPQLFEVSGDDDLVPLVRTRVVGSQLVLDLRGTCAPPARSTRP
jgi:hypothetical protein